MARIRFGSLHGILAGLTWRYAWAWTVGVVLGASLAAAQPISQLPNKGAVSGDAAVPVAADEVAIYCPACPVHPRYSTNRAVAFSALGTFVLNLLSVRELDAAPTVTPWDTLTFDQTDGFVVTDATGGEARVDLAAIPDAALAESYSGVGTCAAGDFVTILNDHAAPTCGTPVSVVDIWVDEAGDTMTGNLLMSNAAGPAIVNEAASATNPTLIPDRSELSSGVGYVVIDGAVTLISGGAEVSRAAISPDGSGTLEWITGQSTTARLALANRNDLVFREAVANGTNYLGFEAPAAVTTNQLCTFENDSSFIPYSCVGTGADPYALTAGGDDTQMQWNNLGVLDGTDSMEWDAAGDQLELDGGFLAGYFAYLSDPTLRIDMQGGGGPEFQANNAGDVTFTLDNAGAGSFHLTVNGIVTAAGDGVGDFRGEYFVSLDNPTGDWLDFTGAAPRIFDDAAASATFASTRTTVSTLLTLVPQASAPGSCAIGDIYVDTSGAYCACTSTNTWSSMTVLVGTCV